MKVGMIARTIPPYDRGGIQTHTLELSKALQKEGVDVHIFAIAEDGFVDGVEVHRVGFFPLPRLTIGQYLSFSLNCLRHMKGVGLDLVHGHSMYSFGFSLKKSKPFVLTIHGTQLNYLRSALRFRPNLNHILTDGLSMIMERYSCKKADKIVCVSEQVAIDTQGQYSIPPRKIHVIPNAVNPSDFEASDLTSNTILSVGRLHQRKGLYEFLDCFSDVAKEIPDASFTIVGTGEEEKRLRNRVAELGLQDDVDFTGYLKQEDLRKKYSEASVFVLPSLYEPFGIVILEAMASGLPIVSLPSEGPSRIMEDGRNGFLVDRGEMAKTLVSLLQDRGLMKRMGDNNLTLVRERFTWTSVAKETKRIYEQALAAT